MTAAAVIVLRLVTAPAAIEMWDQRGEPLPITWRTDGRIEVPRLPGAVGKLRGGAVQSGRST